MAPVDPAAWPKPLDLGNGRVCASFTADGAWLSLGAPHPDHGFVEAGGTEFDEAWRGRADLVRRYRQQLASPGRAAVRFLDVPQVTSCEHRGASLRWTGADATGTLEVDAWTAPTEPVVVQRHVLTAGTDRTARRITLLSTARLTRPAYAEITEVNPLDPPPRRNEVMADGPVLSFVTPSLPATAALRVTVSGGTADGWAIDGRQSRLAVTWVPELEPVLVITLVWTLGAADLVSDVPPPPGPARPADIAPTPVATRLHVPPAQQGRLEEVVAGSLRYVLGCTALTVAPGRRAIITDHRLLQLSWTRDAYYQALLLLAARDREPDAVRAVAEHLGWLWGSCERDEGRWMRSHLANGAIKDRAFQADQQLYPVLELLDHRDLTGRWAPLPDGAPSWGELITQAWQALPIDADLALVSGDENPADDPAGLPYLLSTQILLWWTALRLADRAEELGVVALGCAELADRVRKSVHEHFTATGPFGSQWAYEADGAGRHRLYQDANDLPTALAPLWGFCAADCAEWATTMRFACSPANPAWSAGPMGGLGSLHTPGTWPLGDLQEWVAASLLGDQARAARVLAKVASIASPDGLLPETYDSMTGAWRARHWFAWPSAALATLALGAFERSPTASVQPSLVDPITVKDPHQDP
jgi:uncharacterized protein